MKVVSVIVGAIMLILGIVCLCHPVMTAVSIGWIIGLLLVIGGINALIQNGKDGNSSAWNIVYGILMILLGLSVGSSYLGSIMALDVIVIIMGVLILIAGITRIVTAVRMRAEIDMWVLILITGILSVIVGIGILVNPVTGILMLEIAVAIGIMSQGITLIGAGFSKKPVE